MLPVITPEFDMPQAIQWLIEMTKLAGLPGVKPVRDSVIPLVTIKQSFKASQTLGLKYKKYKIMIDSLVAKLELNGAWSALPRNFEGQHIFISSDFRISLVISHVIGSGLHPSETFEIEVCNLKPKAQAIM